MDWHDIFHQYKDKNDNITRGSAQAILQDLGHLLLNSEALKSFAYDGFSLPMTHGQFVKFIKVNNTRILNDHRSLLHPQLLRKLATTNIPPEERRAYQLAFDIETDIEMSRLPPKTRTSTDDIPYV